MTGSQISASSQLNATLSVPGTECTASGPLSDSYNGTMTSSIEDGGIIFRGTNGVMKLTRESSWKPAGAVRKPPVPATGLAKLIAGSCEPFRDLERAEP